MANSVRVGFVSCWALLGEFIVAMRILNDGMDLIKLCLILGFANLALLGLFLHPEKTVRIGDPPRTAYFSDHTFPDAKEMSYVQYIQGSENPLTSKHESGVSL